MHPIYSLGREQNADIGYIKYVDAHRYFLKSTLVDECHRRIPTSERWISDPAERDHTKAPYSELWWFYNYQIRGTYSSKVVLLVIPQFN